ncbi:respiratory nitrate reductase subunit gamma [Phocaeicola oris]|uniref:respiratory nitrate reductase subunit gamma n=1 Tax=Phocaeicola oris TaxID=2896850 RepID=UPI00234F349B|nr:respiratory nitrate reductase subunit gamma [Phocaeicola oris]MCE2617141.1 respiratory nitrate reductase subunit gamma [Phocaeicola oris]
MFKFIINQMPIEAYLMNLVFCFLPYLIVGIILGGLIYRRKDEQYYAKMRFIALDGEGRLFKFGKGLFYFGFFLLFMGHIIGLLLPQVAYESFAKNEVREQVSLAAGAVSGVIALFGLILVIAHRYENVQLRTADKWLVALLFVQIVTGLLGEVISFTSSTKNYMSIHQWAQGLVIFKPDSWYYLAKVHPLILFHMVIGIMMFLIYPFKLLHLAIALVWQSKHVSSHDMTTVPEEHSPQP